MTTTNKAKLVEKHAETLRMIASNPTAQKRLLGCVERLCGVLCPSLLKVYPLILKQMYDEDVIDEAHILAWAKGKDRRGYMAKEFGFSDVPAATRAELNEANRPFIAWLEVPDEDSEDKSEEESESES